MMKRRIVPMSAAHLGGGSGWPDNQNWAWVPHAAEEPTTSDETPGSEDFQWTEPDWEWQSILPNPLPFVFASELVHVKDIAGTVTLKFNGLEVDVTWAKHIRDSLSLNFIGNSGGYDIYQLDDHMTLGGVYVIIDAVYYPATMGIVRLNINDAETASHFTTGDLVIATDGQDMIDAFSAANPGNWLGLVIGVTINDA